MARYIIQGIARDIVGNILATALVKAYVANTTTLATFYESDSGGASSGIYTDTYGAWKMYFDTADYTYSDSFDIVITKSGYNTQTIEDINPISIASVVPIVQGYVTDAQAAQTAAEAAQTAAEGARDAAQTAETNAELAETNAETAQGLAEGARDAALAAQSAAETAETNAETAETNAETAETNAEAAASLAQEWATNPEDDEITGYGGYYSALHWATKAAASAGSIVSFTNELAQDAIGGILDDGTVGNIVFSYDDTTPKISATLQPSEIKLDDLGTPDDNTDLNASTTAHGLLPKLSNTATEFLNGKGSWATPSGGSAASESTAGIAELATQAEVDAGSDNERIVTPATLAAATSVKWLGASKTVSTSAATGGSDGDIWFKYTA